MKHFTYVLLFLTLFAFLPCAPAYADSITGYLHSSEPGTITFEKAGFILEAPPIAITKYIDLKIEEARLDSDNSTDAYYIMRPLDIDMRDNKQHQISGLPYPVRIVFSFDSLDYKRASNLNTSLPLGRFRIGYLDGSNNQWVQLPSKIFWNGNNGVVECDSNLGAGRYALLWSKEKTVQLSPVIDEGIRLMIDYSIINSIEEPYIKDGRTMVPLRLIAENLGATVEWNAAEQRIDMIRNLEKVQLWIGKTQAVKNNKNIAIDAAPEIVGGRTFVPLRFVSESFGADVSWDGLTRTAKILK